MSVKRGEQTSDVWHAAKYGGRRSSLIQTAAFIEAGASVRAVATGKNGKTKQEVMQSEAQKADQNENANAVWQLSLEAGRS